MQKPSTFARIRALKPKQQIAFNQMLVERMLPNFQLYTELTEQGDFAAVQTVSDLIWQSLYSKTFKMDVLLQQQKVEEQIPAEAESDSLGLYAAIDAGMALIANLSLLDKNNEYKSKEVTLPSVLSQGTIERMLIIGADVENSKEAVQHPHMQWEIETQNEFLDQIELGDQFDKNRCQQLKAFALQDGVTNLGIEF